MTSGNETPYSEQYDWTERAPSTAIVESVASATDMPVTSLEPLYDCLDPDALDRLIESESAAASNVELEFLFSGATVRVCADGRVEVVPE